ncbi:MAG: hypothetical protein U1A23_01315 [Candidatus Sungbacteria bacterium]|nr:hypothetical protein [bacterium]MDZ4285546.1 hypothetical protein [Candidatus Sungbacteria bacterium]
MDILKKYNEETSQSSSQAPQLNLSREYGAITNAVIRLSGGAVKDGKQATLVLLAIAAVVGVSVYFFLSSGRSDLPPLKVISPLLDKAQKIK